MDVILKYTIPYEYLNVYTSIPVIFMCIIDLQPFL
jgi:hypothetical protein